LCSFHHSHALRLLHSFPTRRSSDLNRDAARAAALSSDLSGGAAAERGEICRVGEAIRSTEEDAPRQHRGHRARITTRVGTARPADRKSTRLNSSHVAISYAVFCLKK